MDQREQARLIASLTDDELSALRARAGAPSDDAEGQDGDDQAGDTDDERQFLRRLSSKPNSWLAETLDRLGAAQSAGDGDEDGRAFIRQLLSNAHGGPPAPPNTDQTT
ncbi:hypothetical protein [Mycobacterium sp. IDR2000157661]|uniref:hypothetical protein n=1 Tax=Mycobacterium sp. IDR2000157661 TaxID=2867005 RepID=UPI001EEE5D61|nr:hypothetical protein [Mycobacterium sp. IDR2000157661]ULE35049.1 hypothetical protein K3G64_11045 [Mycobacterium sp. IDR2000157661]